MDSGLRVNPEGVPYSGLSGWQRSPETGNCPEKVKEMDVSNGPDSGRDLAAASTNRMSSLCQNRSIPIMGKLQGEQK